MVLPVARLVLVRVAVTFEALRDQDMDGLVNRAIKASTGIRVLMRVRKRVLVCAGNRQAILGPPFWSLRAHGQLDAGVIALRPNQRSAPMPMVVSDWRTE